MTSRQFEIVKKRIFPAAFLVILVLGVQLPGIARPFGGHFASYQSSVMAAISRNIVHENFSDLLIPKMDLMVSGERAWHLNQYPFPSLAVAVLKKMSGGSYEMLGRLQAVLCNLISILLCGLIAARLLGSRQGWAAAYLYGLSPFSLIYGQAFMSEAMALCGLLAAYYFYLRSVETSTWNYPRLILAGVLLSTALTGRIHLALVGPFFAMDILRRRRSFFAAFLFGLAALLLPLLWYGYTYFASIDSTHVITNIFIQKAARPANAISQYWSMEFIGHLLWVVGARVMTPAAWPLFFAGCWAIRKKFFALWVLISSLGLQLLMCVLLPQKVTAHEFYLIGLTPFLAMGCAAGIISLGERFHFLNLRLFRVVFVAGYFLMSLRLSAGPVFSQQKDIQEVLAAAQYTQTHTLPTDKIVIFGDGPAVAAYYVNRPCRTMELSALGGELSYYLKDTRFTKADPMEIQREELAMRDFVTWLDYLRQVGIQYFLAPNRDELDSQKKLLEYLKATAVEVNPRDAGFYLFQLKQ